MLAKGRDVAADAVIFDLEDSVPLDQKDTARHAVAETLRAWPDSGVPVPYVRIQPPRFHVLPQDAEVLAANARAGIVVPKVNRPVELQSLRDHPGTAGKPNIVIIETPRSLFQLEAFADVTGVEGLALGAEDLSLSLGMREPNTGNGLTVASLLLVAAARAAGIAAYDSICPEFRDLDVVARDGEQAVAAGFDGKLAIHPAQIPVIRQAFMPSQDRVAWAREVVEAFEGALAKGQGAVQVHGQMVDQPVADRARAILDLAGRLSADDRRSEESGSPDKPNS